MFVKDPIRVDKEKCIGCSLCVKDCPNGYLRIENGKACISEDAGCIECGHCFAVCPKQAVIMKNYPVTDEPFVSMTEIDSAVLLAAMKSRRTIRHFKPQTVEQSVINKILEAGQYCPTATNAQNVNFTILGKRQGKIEKECVALFRRIQKIAAPFAKIVRSMEIDDNYFFKKAPLVIVVSSKDNINAGLASSYMELEAESLGLGVLYSGFFVVCSKLSGKIRRMLELPKVDKVVACMVMGYPAVKYQRIAPRRKRKTKVLD